MLPYTVRCSPSILAAADDFFFDEKVLCVRRGDRYPDANPVYGVRWKTCLRNMANTFYKLFAVCHFFVVSPLFRYCLRIVYSGLNNIKHNIYTAATAVYFLSKRTELWFLWCRILQAEQRVLWRITLLIPYIYDKNAQLNLALNRGREIKRKRLLFYVRTMTFGTGVTVVQHIPIRFLQTF